MKRVELIKQLTAKGAIFVRHGSNLDIRIMIYTTEKR